MPRSDEAVRERIATEVEKRGRIEAASIEDLKQKLDMSDVSNSKLDRALRSLHYNSAYHSKGVRFRRVRLGSVDPFTRREYVVFYTGIRRLLT